MHAYLERRTYQSDFAVSAFYAENNNFLAHWHLDVELVYVCSGSIRIGINKETRILTQGEMAVFRSTDIHYYDSKGRQSQIIVLIFRPELIGSAGGWPENRRFVTAFIDKKVIASFGDNERTTIGGLFPLLVDELKEGKPFYRLYVGGKLAELCALLLRSLPTRDAGPDDTGKMPDILRIQTAIEYLKHHYAEEISLTSIAGVSRLSPYYFSRLFAKFTGIPFTEYLTRIRIEQAQRMIQGRSGSIIDVAFACGFNSIRTFNRAFKAVKGYAPSQIRFLKKDSDLPRADLGNPIDR